MRLHRGQDIRPDGSGLVCRQSRWGGLIFSVILVAAFVGSPIFLWLSGAPLVFTAVMATTALFVVPLILGDTLARFRGTNWLLWIQPDRLLVNLRSYQDRSSLAKVSVVELSDADVSQLQEHRDRYSTPGSRRGGTAHHALQSLDIVLRQPVSAELATALAECRRRAQPERTWLGFITSRSRLTHFAISQPAEDRLRLAWWGGQSHGVRPSLSTVLARLEHRYLIAESSEQARGDWQSLTEAELDDQILALVVHGNSLAAIKLLRQRRGMSLREARAFVDALTSQTS